MGHVAKGSQSADAYARYCHELATGVLEKLATARRSNMYPAHPTCRVQIFLLISRAWTLLWHLSSHLPHKGAPEAHHSLQLGGVLENQELPTTRQFLQSTEIDIPTLRQQGTAVAGVTIL